MKDKKYHSPFTRVSVTKNGGEKIQQLQYEFDRFWKKVNRVSDKCPEKFHAMKAMQEACMWLTRACALANEKLPETIIDDPLKPSDLTRCNGSEHVGDAMRYLNPKGTLGHLKEGQVNQNNPRFIVVKRKKI